VPTALTHPAVPLALGLGLGRELVPARLLAAGAVASVLPDLDVVGLRLGIPYASELGHRGLSHSLAFAVLVALGAAALHRALRASAPATFAFVLVAAASHGVLDALTNGGLGVALLWPLSDERLFAPIRPILVAPLGARGLVARGAAVLASEARWVWLPGALLGLALVAGRHVARRGGATARREA
jgi:inner membrane protein